MKSDKSKKPAAASGPATDDAARFVKNNGAALGKLDGYIGFHLRLAQNASFKAFKKKTGQDDLRQGWFAVLSLIRDNPGITPMALSRASGRDKSTLTPVLRDLLKLGYLARKASASDGRSYSLFLTPAGEERLSRLAAHAIEHDDVLDAIVGEDKPLLIELLRRIWKGLE